jgi:hypothetical protein
VAITCRSRAHWCVELRGRGRCPKARQREGGTGYERGCHHSKFPARYICTLRHFISPLRARPDPDQVSVPGNTRLADIDAMWLFYRQILENEFRSVSASHGAPWQFVLDLSANTSRVAGGRAFPAPMPAKAFRPSGAKSGLVAQKLEFQ